MSQGDVECASGNTFCVVLNHEKEVIVVPVVLLVIFLVALLTIFLLKFCPDRTPAPTLLPNTTPPQGNRASRHKHRRTRSQRHNLRGIDAPTELNPLEHEVVPITTPSRTMAPPTLAAVPEMASERQPGSFQLVTPLPRSLFVIPGASVTVYRARMENRDVVLRVLKESADAGERQHFLGFASFLSELGPHPFLPDMMGVVSVRSPMVTVIEELEHRDLLGYLWRCRQDHTGEGSPCDLTEKRIFIMAGQVASALEYLHSKSCIHGNLGARSVLVGQDLTAKLWGLGPAYRRRGQMGTPWELEDMELRKWQAPEILARRDINQSSDIWSFGILLYEMVTLGDPPFPKVLASELLQYLQRGNSMKRPVSCSNSLYSTIKSCVQWSPQERLPLAGLIRKIQSGERSANDRTVLRVPEPLDTEKYLREAGYGEAYNYAVL
ncbi:tyrosine-protein kinase STYK1 [Osmerus mordax]|uniref:tyrosine-protein kinase STYK1 n=1 Tax=Osmerus mordax TaxID=8014 RepID=UPI00350F779E